MLYEPVALLVARLATMVAAAGEWENCEVALYQEGEFTPNSGMTYAQLVAGECDFSGYARSATVVWNAPYVHAVKRAILTGGSVQFKATAATIGNSVGGYAIVDVAGTKIFWAEAFDAPITIDEANDAITVLPRYEYGRRAA